jgi:hypothetical protein
MVRMPFVANRDIKIEASQGSDGAFTLRTKGLDARRRPELEMAGVPEVALHAAGGVLNEIADYAVNRAEVLADQNVGFVITGDDEDDLPMMLAVRTTATVAPSGGLWSKITGGGKGVLRLVDVAGERAGPPLTALATMLLHRARVRLAKDDEGGAREEIEAAIAIFPGAPRAGRAPEVGDGAAVFNWQNHLAYLALAELGGDDAAHRYGEALARSDELSVRELGAPLDAFGSLDAASLERRAAAIVDGNREVRRQPGPTEALAIVASPVWETTDASAKRGARRASLVPATFVSRYLDGPAPDARLAARVMARVMATHPAADLAWRVRKTRTIWIAEAAPVLADIEGYDPTQALLSAVLADVVRSARAGATDDEIAARLAGAAPASLAPKLAAADAWEAEQYAAAMKL